MEIKHILKFFISGLNTAGFLCFALQGVSGYSQKATEMLWTAVEEDDWMGIVDAVHSQADLKWRNVSGFNALHLAASRGHVETMSVLLMAGADKEALTESCDRPLHLAIAKGSIAAVALLAAAGADIKAIDSQEQSPIMEAMSSGKNATAALLRTLLHTHFQEVKGVTQKATEMLWTAVEKNDLMGILDAIHSQADLKWRNESGFSALHLAASRGHVETMSVLLLAGADKEAVTSSADRPLHLAVARGSDEAVSLLAAAGADIKAADTEGLSPVMKAVFRGRKSTVTLLRALTYAHDAETMAVCAGQPSLKSKDVDAKLIERCSGRSGIKFKNADSETEAMSSEKSGIEFKNAVSWHWGVNLIVSLILLRRGDHGLLL